MPDIYHSWGTSPKQKAREKEYNHWYYEKFKDRILKSRKFSRYNPNNKDYQNGDFYRTANNGRYEAWAGSYSDDSQGRGPGHFITLRQESNSMRPDTSGERHSKGMEYVSRGDNASELTFWNTAGATPMGKKDLNIKIGDVKISRDSEAAWLTMDLAGVTKLTDLGVSVINTGKSIIDKLRGKRG